MADETIFEQSVDSAGKQHPFVKKEVVYVIDQNNGSYSGQIVLDTSTISNSAKWASYSEAYFAIPLTISSVCDNDISAAFGPYCVGFKSGFWNLIDSLVVDYNGTNVIQQTAGYYNMFTTFKVLTTWSQDTYNKYGASCGFYKDVSDAWQYSGAASRIGNGFSANRIYQATFPVADPSAATAFTGSLSNLGYWQRLKNVGYTRWLGVGVTAANVASVGEGSFQTSGAGAARIYYTTVIAKIRLCDLHDFFKQIPLLRGSYLRFTLNINAPNTFVITGSANPGPVQSVSSSTFARNTNPVMFSSGEATQPNAATITNTYNTTVTLTVGNVANITQAFTSCRLYVPLYTMAPEYEQQYITSNPTIQINYDDVFQYTIPSVTSGSTFNTLLTNGLVNPKMLVVAPYYTSGANGALALDEFKSPYSPVGGTTSYQPVLKDFQVQLSGVNVFQDQQRYGFSTFMDEVSKTGLMGGQNSEMTSGLINEQDWTNCYRFYVADLSRRLPSEDPFPRSVLVSGQNISGLDLNLCTFVTFGKNVTVDVSNGSIVSV